MFTGLKTYSDEVGFGRIALMKESGCDDDNGGNDNEDNGNCGSNDGNGNSGKIPYTQDDGITVNFRIGGGSKGNVKPNTKSV